MTRAWLASLGTALLTLTAQVSHAQGPLMTVPGFFDVSPAGAATYTIPVQVPPGTAGMQPSLALNYASNSGNGVAGLGWYVGGLSTIDRCPRTVAQDGARSAVRYDSNDRYCMGGLRLVAVDGSYGADGTEYRTEIDSYSKVIGHGSANGHQWFQVWTRSGQILEYGNTADSKLMTQDDTAVRRWHVNRIADHAGNYQAISYHNDAANGFIRPERIDYSGNTNTSLTPYNSVRFAYETRLDQAPLYYRGSYSQMTHRLTAIDTYAGSTLVRRYQLGYATESNLRASQLTSVTLCDGASNCLPATTFTWPAAIDPATFASSNKTFLNDPTVASTVTGDFNGDGLPDFFSVPYVHTSDWGTRYTTSTADTSVESNGWLSSVDDDIVQYSTDNMPATYQGQTWVSSGSFIDAAGDFNGDGYTDITLSQIGNYATGTWVTGTYGPVRSSVNLNNGNGRLSITEMNNVPHRNALPFGDFNGDGRDDLLILQVSPNGARRYLSNGDGTFTIQSPISGLYSDSVVFPGDFDGDGCTDILTQGQVNRIYFSCGSTGTYIDISNWTGAGYKLNLSDFNGDGLTDVLLTHTGYTASQLWLSTGTDLEQVWTGPQRWANYAVSGGDFNGDGRADVILVAHQTNPYSPYASPTPHQVFLSTGTGFVEGGTIDNPNIVTGFRVMDFNGDGLTDVYVRTSGTKKIFTNQGIAQRISRITDGWGEEIRISYDRLNGDGTTYAKSSATYPLVAIIGPQAVVSAVEMPNGVGGRNTSTYRYAGAQFDYQGRGLLGFGWRYMTDPIGRVHTTIYRRDFPFAGQVSSQLTQYNGVDLRLVQHTYQKTALTSTGGDYHQIRLTQTVESNRDLSNATLPGLTTQYSYDSYGNVTTRVVTRSTNVRTTTSTYFNDDNKWLIGLLASQSTQHTQTGLPSITRESAYLYHSTTGLLTKSQIEPGNSGVRLTTDYAYDSYGNVVGITVSGADIATITTTQSYDTQGRFVLSTTNAKSQPDSFTWDGALGALLSHTDPNGRVSTREYDGYGRITKSIDPDGRQLAFLYQYCDGVLGGTAWCAPHAAMRVLLRPFRADGTTYSGSQELVVYDKLGRALLQGYERDSGKWAISETRFDAWGRPHQSTHHPYFRNIDTPEWVTRTYDALHRVVTQTLPDSSSSANTYSGAYISSTNGLSQTQTTQYNALGQLYRITDPGSLVTEYGYNSAGELIQVTDPAGNITTQSYDVRGRVIERDDPNLGLWSYDYTVLNQLKQQTDAKSQVSSLSYDVLGRITQQVAPDLTSTFVYDTATNGIGLLHYMETSAGDRRTHGYNAHGRPNQTTIRIDNQDYIYKQAYNSDGRLNTLEYPSGYKVQYVYNGNQRVLSTLREYGTNTLLWNALRADRDASGQATFMRLGSNAQVTHQFDADTHRLTGIQAGAYGGPTNDLVQLSYQYDALGNPTSRYDALEVLNETFDYDNLNRLTHATTDSITRVVEYDMVGNITKKRTLGDTTNNVYTYPTPGLSQPNAVSQVTGVVNGVTNPTFSYDDNGNLLSGAGRTLSWTSFDKVASLTEAGTTLDFTYDATQQRIKQSDGNNTILYLDDPVSGASAEYHTDNGGEWHDYLSADGRRVGIRKEVISPSDINFQFFIQDNQGSVIAVLNEDGTMSQKLSYDAWGLRRNVDGSEDVSNSINPPVSRGYTDHEHLPGSQIINMNGRMYDPELGRHLSADPYTPDPFSSQGYNRYSYVYNNPLRYVDPSGYEPNCPGCPFIVATATRSDRDPFGSYFLQRSMRALAGSFSYGTEVASIYVDIEALEREIAEGLKNLAKVDDGDEGGSGSLGDTPVVDTDKETEQEVAQDGQGAGQSDRQGDSTPGVIHEILVRPEGVGSLVGGYRNLIGGVRDWISSNILGIPEVYRDGERIAVGIIPFGPKIAGGTYSLATHIPSTGRKFNQIIQRGWSRDSINQVVNNPFATRAATNRATGNPATAYFRPDGHYIVRDNLNGNLVQMSDTRLRIGSGAGQWQPDPSIVNPIIGL